MFQPYPVRAVLFGSGVFLVCSMLIALWVQSQAALLPWLEPIGLVSIDSAVGFFIAGLGLIGSALGARWPPLIASGLLLLLALLNLVTAYAGLPLSLRLLLDSQYALTEGLSNSAMPNMILGMLVTGLILPLFPPAEHPLRVPLLGVGSVLLICSAVVPLAGYVLGLEPALYWPGFGHMSALSGVALFLMGGAGLFTAGYGNPGLESNRVSLWPPVALGLGAFTLSAFLSIALANAQTHYVASAVRTDATNIARELENRLQVQIRNLRRISRRIEGDTTPVEPGMVAAAAEQVFLNGYQGMAWLTPELDIRFALPGAEDGGVLLTPSLLRREVSRAPVMQALREGSHAVSAPVVGNAGQVGFYIFMPVRRNDALLGVLAVSYDIEDTLDPVLAGFAERGLVIEVLVEAQAGQEVLYSMGLARKYEGRDLTARVPGADRLSGVGPSWTLAVSPTDALVQRYRNRLPETVLLLGSVLGLLAAFSMHTRKMLTRSHRQVHELNEQLERKVRRRTEALLREVTERERYAAKLAHAAKHDSLTDLPNRQLFAELLIHALAETRRSGSTLVVMFIDLDNFKEVNDSFGHAAGDELLRQVARRMRYTLRQSDVVARQGGDEFLVLADTLSQPLDASELATKLLLALNRGFPLGEQTVHVAVSIGLASFPGEGYEGSDQEVASALIRNADTAMYQAKKNGKNRYEFHSRELQERIQARLEIKHALSEALQKDELQVYYQPRITLHDRQVVGAEALLRWNHPVRGWISPEEFIPVAEETGIVVELGRWVLDRVCRDLLLWQRRDTALPLISVNASIHQFRDQQILLDMRQRLKQWPGIQNHLELELTERVWIDERPEYRQLLREIHRLGVRIAIDDFGTGCSSLSYFSRFPIDVLKIDKSFIKHLMKNREHAMIARSIIDLGRNFELTVVAEGVETEDQFRRLRDYGCHEGQGFLFARAMPADAFIDCWQGNLRAVDQ